MAEPQFEESVVSADRWSKLIAVFVAIGVFLVARRLTGDAQFGSIVAAFAGIGARLYVPYHASMQVSESARVPLLEASMAGSYHHGAAGLSLVVASLVALGVSVLGHGFLVAVGSGVISGVVGYLVFRVWLPTA